MSYQKAWRSRKKAIEDVGGKSSESYDKLAKFMYMVTLTNSGSTVELQYTATSEKSTNAQFQYAFMAIRACINGWKYCRPVMVVDAIFLKSTHKGTLMIATTEDAGGKIFPLAFAIMDSENDESWEWFFGQLRLAFGVRENMCIISDRHPSIQKATKKVFPEVAHGYCIYHLLNNLKLHFKKGGKSLSKSFLGAAKAYTVMKFKHYMEELASIDEGIPEYLENVGFDKWARVHCKYNRYHFMTSNIVESLNSIHKYARELSITTLLLTIHGMIQERTAKNITKASNTQTTLIKKSENMLKLRFNDSMKLKVIEASATLFSVMDEKKTYIVNLKEKTCTYNKFQMDEMPCFHAISVLRKYNTSSYTYYSIYHKIETQRLTYENTVHPIPNEESWEIPKEIDNYKILPPDAKIQAGMLKKKELKANLRQRNLTSVEIVEKQDTTKQDATFKKTKK